MYSIIAEPNFNLCWALVKIKVQYTVQILYNIHCSLTMRKIDMCTCPVILFWLGYLSQTSNSNNITP